MSEVKALLVFCEGSHDIAFVQQVLKLCLGFHFVKWKFSEYPSPFNSLFKKSVQDHAAGDLSLDMAHKFFLPDSVLQKSEHLVLLFNSGDSSFEWKTSSTDKQQQIAEISKRKKSIITCVGQRNNSGYSLSVIIKNETKKLIKDDTFLQNSSVISFADFIEKFMK